MLLFQIENPNLAATVPMMLFVRKAEECHVTIPSLMVAYNISSQIRFKNFAFSTLYIYVIFLNDMQYLPTNIRICSKFKHKIKKRQISKPNICV